MGFESALTTVIYAISAVVVVLISILTAKIYSKEGAR